MKTFRNISMEELDRLGIDEANRLYWNGQPLVTKSEVTLSGWLNVAAVLAALAAVVTAAVDLLTFFGFSAK